MLEHLADLESDFSALHRIDDMGELPSDRFFRMAYRLAAYGGVMAARQAAEIMDLQHDGPVMPAQILLQMEPGKSKPEGRIVSVDQMALENPDLFGPAA